MASIILDADLERTIIEDRQARGADHFDEVWEGVYIMAPLADNEHQRLATRLATVLDQVIQEHGLGAVYAGCNVSDRQADWTKNYRVPDVAVFLTTNHAIDRQTHWFGGPDLAIEITSAGDRSRDKFDFYANVATKEVLIIDRDPWQLELHHLESGSYSLVSQNRPGDDEPVVSRVTGISFSLGRSVGDRRPPLQMLQLETGTTWTF